MTRHGNGKGMACGVLTYFKDKIFSGRGNNVPHQGRWNEDGQRHIQLLVFRHLNSLGTRRGVVGQDLKKRHDPNRRE